MISENFAIETPDTKLAAFFLAGGYGDLKKSYMEGEKIFFRFEDFVQNPHELSSLFYRRKVQVEPLAYSEAYKKMKSIIKSYES